MGHANVETRNKVKFDTNGNLEIGKKKTKTWNK